MIQVNVYANHRGIETELSVPEISDVLNAGCELLWVDVVNPRPMTCG